MAQARRRPNQDALMDRFNAPGIDIGEFNPNIPQAPTPAPMPEAPPVAAPAPAGTYDRTQTRDFFMSNTPGSVADIDRWITENPFMAGVKRITNDVVEMPNGERYDIWGNMGGSGQRGTWTPVPGRAGTEWAGMPGQGGGGAAPAPQAPTGSSMGSLNPLLSADPNSGIQNALAQYTGQSDNLKALLAQLGA